MSDWKGGGVVWAQFPWDGGKGGTTKAHTQF